MYEVQSISYHGGCCGDFVRLLLVTGDKNVDDVKVAETGEVSLHVTSTDYWHEDFCRIDEAGAVRSLKALNHIADFYKRFYVDNIDSMKTVEDYIETIDMKYLYIGNHIKSITKRWSLNYSIHTIHDYTVFLEKFNGLKEFYTYMDYLTVKRTLFIVPTTSNSVSIMNNNKYHKNDSTTPFTVIQMNKEYDILQKEKRNNDIILELEDVYDKEKLRKFLTDNYVWEDKNFDIIYDEYMNKQPF